MFFWFFLVKIEDFVWKSSGQSNFSRLIWDITSVTWINSRWSNVYFCFSTRHTKIKYWICTYRIVFFFFFHSIFIFIRITTKIDDDMLSFYCNEDIFSLEVRKKLKIKLNISIFSIKSETWYLCTVCVCVSYTR